MPRPRLTSRLTLALVLAALCALPTRAFCFDLEGHRGARGLAPENTLAAFERAMAIGVDTLELDVHLSADGVPMVSHDPALQRDLTRDMSGQFLATDGPLIRSLTRDELQQRYQLGRARPDSAVARNFPQQVAVDGQRLPTLAEVLALLQRPGAQRLRANIELKMNPHRPDDTPPAAVIVDAVLATLRSAGALDRVSIQGFDWRALRLVQQRAPRVPTAYLSAQRPGFDTITDGTWTDGHTLAQHGSVPAMVQAAGGRLWSPAFADLTEALVRDAHQRGLQVLPWTVNNPADMARLLAWGVDGLITDYPDRARAVLRERGLPLPTPVPAGTP
jgi:glycerophosphoryl diester phosphodiesterase